jgi:hypothetical protein
MPSMAAGSYQTSIGIGAYKEGERDLQSASTGDAQAAVPTGILAMMLIAPPFSHLRAFLTSSKWAVAAGPIEDPRSRRICVPGIPGSARAPRPTGA